MTTIGTTSRPAYVYDADTDTWVPIGVGPHTHDEYIDKVLFDNKGDILVGTGEDTLGKLAVGEDGQFLVVDLDEPTGLTWRTLNANIDVSATAPSGPTSGSVWFNSSEGIAYIYYDSYWVPLSPSQAGPQGDAGVFVSATAPLNTDVIWVDTDEDPDVPVPAGGSAGQILQKTSNDDYQTAWVNPPSGNAIINGAFEINQRNFTSSTVTGYAFDRWQNISQGDGTTIFSSQAFALGSAPVVGYEATNHLRIFTSGQTNSSVVSLVEQRIEGVRSFAGQTVTVSFFAKSLSGSPQIALEMLQNFGSSGSASVFLTPTKIQISTTWTRYSATFQIPSIAGKTIGAGDYLRLLLWVSAGADNNARTASLGIQSNTFDIWGIQLEAGPVATAFRRNANSIQGELAACQRYYWRWTPGSVYGTIAVAVAGNSTNGDCPVVHPVTMRASPTSIEFQNMGTIRPGVNSYSVSSLTIGYASPDSTLVLYASSNGASQGQSVLLMSFNTTNAYVALSAEL